MSEIALSLKNIVRVYTQGDNSFAPLNHLDLEVRRGEAVALVGPSGSGKTTLLQIAGLLDQPTSGEVAIHGENMTNASDKIRTLARSRNIGFIYQFHNLLPEFSAVENVALPQMIAGVSESKARQKAADILDKLGLSERLSHRPAKLSGGEQQRVALARALANDPALLLADEPTGNLDPTTAEAAFGLLMRVSREQNVALLVATHNLDIARRMDRAVRLEGGILK